MGDVKPQAGQIWISKDSRDALYITKVTREVCYYIWGENLKGTEALSASSFDKSNQHAVSIGSLVQSSFYPMLTDRLSMRFKISSE